MEYRDIGNKKSIFGPDRFELYTDCDKRHPLMLNCKKREALNLMTGNKSQIFSLRKLMTSSL